MTRGQTESLAEGIVRRAFPFFGAGGLRGDMVARVLARSLPGALEVPHGRDGASVQRLVQALQDMALTAETRRALVAEIRRDMDELLLVYSEVIADCAARLVAQRATQGHRDAARACEVVSIGCGAGWKEEILARRISQRGLAVNWIGLDKEDPDSEPLEGMFRPEHNYFQADACQTDSYTRAARAGPDTIIIASYLVHHLPLAPEEFLRKCAGARAVVLLEEPMSEEEAQDPELVLARLAYEVLANYAFNGATLERILQASGGYWLRYWTDAEVTRLQGRSVSIPRISPRTSILIFDNPCQFPRDS